MSDNTAVFDDTNNNWSRDAIANYLFLKAVKGHMNNVLVIRGYVFLNDVFSALGIPHTRFGQTHGWVYNSGTGDGYIDFGVSTDGITLEPVTLTFNVDGDILDTLQ